MTVENAGTLCIIAKALSFKLILPSGGGGFRASAFQDIWLSGYFLIKDIDSYFYVRAKVFCRFNPPNIFCCGNSYDVDCPWQLNYYKVNLLVAYRNVNENMLDL